MIYDISDLFFTDHRSQIINFHQILFISSINVCVLNKLLRKLSLYLIIKQKHLQYIYMAINSTNSCLTKSIFASFLCENICWSSDYTSPAGGIYNESNVVHSISVFEGKTWQTLSEFNILYNFELFKIAVYGIITYIKIKSWVWKRIIFFSAIKCLILTNLFGLPSTGCFFLHWYPL